jgi:hypothetical protein
MPFFRKLDCRVKPGNDGWCVSAKPSPENGAILASPQPRELRMIAKLLLQNLIWIVVLGALLFVPAGTLHWPAAWLFLGTIGILGVAGGLWLRNTIRHCSLSACAR